MQTLAVNFWLIVRAVVLLSGILDASSFVPGAHSPFGGGTVTVLLIFFGFGMVAMVLVVGSQAINPRSAAAWTRPGWHANPFSLKQPVQFFHMAGFYFIVVGLTAIALAQIRHLTGLEPFLPVALGVGVLVGIRCCTALYRRKFG